MLILESCESRFRQGLMVNIKKEEKEMKKKNMVVIGMVVGCLMMVAGAAWAAQANYTGTVNTNGTITIGTLVWLKNPNNCTGDMNWGAAMSRAKSLASGQCGLTDGSKAGDWRLANTEELLYICHNKGLFQNIGDGDYWSSDAGKNYNYSLNRYEDGAVLVSFNFLGCLQNGVDMKTTNHFSWPVRSAP